ncbi:alpha/beta hydrolase family esterase [Undibacterium sp. Ji67W]|uniref:alpha/beta hydrolase family esterase n=1 Tax=Undibacterium sp. Ji67W TaxID=3413042 RepID=UPI003BF06ED3
MSIFSRLSAALQIGFGGVNRAVGKTASVSSGQLKRPEGMRQFLLGLPSQATNAKRPLVLVLHGAGANAKQVLGMAFPPSPLSVWLEVAERENLVVIAPDGNQTMTSRCWNDGYADIASNPATDDVGLISDLIDKAIVEYQVDPARVYLIGVSKGGMMAYRVATEIAPRLAAFGAILASMPVNSNCGMPQTALSALIVANTKDPLVRYQGGKFFYTFSMHAPALSIESSVAVWRDLAGLPNEPEITPIPRRVPGSHTSATRQVWGKNKQQLQVSFIKVEGGGHAEPSERKRYPWLLTRMIGEQNGDFEVAEEAWAFFKNKRSGLQP